MTSWRTYDGSALIIGLSVIQIVWQAYCGVLALRDMWDERRKRRLERRPRVDELVRLIDDHHELAALVQVGGAPPGTETRNGAPDAA